MSSILGSSNLKIGKCLNTFPGQHKISFNFPSLMNMRANKVSLDVLFQVRCAHFECFFAQCYRLKQSHLKWVLHFADIWNILPSSWEVLSSAVCVAVRRAGCAVGRSHCRAPTTDALIQPAMERRAEVNLFPLRSAQYTIDLGGSTGRQIYMLLLETPYILLEHGQGRGWPRGPKHRLFCSCSPPHDLISSLWTMTQREHIDYILIPCS